MAQWKVILDGGGSVTVEAAKLVAHYKNDGAASLFEFHDANHVLVAAFTGPKAAYRLDVWAKPDS